jgi:hypothetical protein
MKVLAVFGLLLVGVTGVLELSFANDDLGRRASWQAPTAADARTAVDEWLKGRQLTELEQLKLNALWPTEDSATSNEGLLNNVGVTIALLIPESREIVDLCRGDRQSPIAREFAILADEKTHPFVRSNLQLLYGRWLVQNELHDEALALLDDVEVSDVVDPAGLLFYQSVARHSLLDKESCLSSLEKLLEQEDQIPKRYATLAQLMTADLKSPKPNKVIGTLDEVARIMSDIERRQRLFRAGTRVRKQEEDVIAKLDELIEELEKSGGGSGSGSGSLQPSSPMQDSTPGGGTGPGNVDPRRLTPGGDWGKVPPKQREAAMAELAKDLPAHYREVIEEYFRNIARDVDAP